ncbi:MAG TPA: type II toxin-antitoxin system PemK/MazF family toxin [Trueperaceae bacterium]
MIRGDICYADLDPSIGSEANKRRPCLIVSNDANNRAANTITVLPVTSNVERIYPFEVLVETELGKPCKVQINQVRTISKQRLSGAPLTRLPEETMHLVDDALRLHLDL